MATHSSILAWRIPRTEEPGGLQSVGSQRVRQDWQTNTFIHSQKGTVDMLANFSSRQQSSNTREAEDAWQQWFLRSPLVFSKRSQGNKYIWNGKDIAEGPCNKSQTVGCTNCCEESCFLPCFLFLVPWGKHKRIWSKKAGGTNGAGWWVTRWKMLPRGGPQRYTPQIYSCGTCNDTEARRWVLSLHL